MKKILFPALVFIFLVLPPPGIAEVDPLMIRLLPSAETGGGQIRLAEIARISGGSERQRRKLARLPIAPSPSRGGVISLSLPYVDRVLQRNRFDDFILSGARRVRVRRAARILRRAEVVSDVKAFLKRKVNLRGESAEILSVNIPKQKVLLPEGPVELSVEAPSKTRFIGKTPLQLVIRQKGAELRRIWVRADIAVYANVPVLRQAVRARQPLSPALFEIRRENLAKLPSDVVTDLEDLEGARAVRVLSPGETIRKSDVRFPYLVKQGHLVRIVARYKALEITTYGKALDRGRNGEVVRIVNLQSRKIIQARVVGQALVEVLF